MEYLLFTLAMIDHELAERARPEGRSDIGNRDEEQHDRRAPTRRHRHEIPTAYRHPHELEIWK